MSGPCSLPRLSLLTLVALVTLASSGCTSFRPSQLDVLGVFAPRRPSPPAPGEPAYTVVTVPSLGRVEEFAVPYDKAITVQEALQQTGAMYHFAQADIYIERMVPKAGKSHKLTVTYDTVAGRVSPETDYAIYPGDRLVVREDRTTLLEKTLDGIKH